MRLWIVSHYAIPPSSAGITRHYSIAKWLIRLGHEVVVIASSFEHLAKQDSHLLDGEQSKLEVLDGVPFLWIRSPAYKDNSARRIWNMISFGFEVWKGSHLGKLPKPDIILGSSPDPLGALAAERIARRIAIPFVLEVRDLWPLSLTEFGKYSPFHPGIVVLSHIEQYLYRNSKAIIAVMPNAVEHIASKCGNPGSVVWLPNGIDLEFAPVPKQRPDSGEFVVIYAGAHGIANDLDTIIEAARIIESRPAGSRIRFRLIGEGPEKPRLIEKTKSMGLEYVEFLPPVSKRKVFDFLEQADAFLSTTRRSELYKTGLSFNKLFDYMAMARPIVFSADSSNNPVTEAQCGMTVSPESPQDLAESILALERMSSTERHEIGLKGREYVSQRHSLEVIASHLEDVLSTILTSTD